MKPQPESPDPSTDAKARIWAEERFRLVVAQELQRQQAQSLRPWQSFLIFLNSSFGLWLLSALLLTGAGSMIAKWSADREQERQRKERVEHLDLEIAYRLSRSLYAAREMWGLIHRHDSLVKMGHGDSQPLRFGQSDEAVKDVRTALLDEATQLRKEIESADPPLVLLSRAPEGRFPALYPEY